MISFHCLNVVLTLAGGDGRHCCIITACKRKGTSSCG